MSLRLNFQEPSALAGYLLEALIEASERARSGGGIFAWASVDGIRLLFHTKAFTSFLDESEHFKLVIGVDAITNVAALEAIEAEIARAPALDARVFFHERRPLLFHPKFSWFRAEGGMTLIAGSGNLTRGGLRSNWEAFTVATVGEAEAARLQGEIDDWFARCSGLLLPTDDPRVRERAGRNTGRERDVQVPASAELGRGLEAQEARIYETGEPVLVAELSRSRGGPTQANIHLKHYEEFFGARKGTKRHIVLRRVEAGGTLSEDEPRPSVEVASRNYRFELAGLRGREYPSDGKPVAVFLRTAGGIFLYRPLFPGDSGHSEMASFLDERKPVPGRLMRQERASVDELRTAWPDSPLLRAVPPA